MQSLKYNSLSVSWHPSCSAFVFPLLSPHVHTFLSVLPSWSTRLFCWFSEQQFGPSEGQRQVKFCFDDSKWRDYPNERQLSKPHPSLQPSISLGYFIPPNARASPSQAIHHIHYLIPPALPFFLLFFFLIMFSSLHHLNLFIPSSLTFTFIFPSLPSPVKTHPSHFLPFFFILLHFHIFVAFPFTLSLPFSQGSQIGHKVSLSKRNLINILFLFSG